MKKSLWQISFLTMLLTSCVGNSAGDHDVQELKWELAERDSSEIWNFYTNVEFIPFDNSLKGTIHYAHKLVAADSSLYVLDMGELDAEVKKYDAEGHYLHDIGRIGHARGEYQDLLDFALSETGDTIMLLTRTSIMAYNSDGKYLFSETPVNEGFIGNIQGVKGGYMCTTGYTGAEMILHYIDGKGSVQSELLPTQGTTIGHPSIVGNPIQSDGYHAYYYDSYASMLYQLNVDSSSVQRAVHFDSKYALSLSKFSNENVYDENMDHVCNYIVDGDLVIGNVRLTEPSYGTPLFVYNISTGKIRLHDTRGYAPRLELAHGGSHYAIIAQEDFMNLRPVMKAYQMSESLKSNYFEVIDSVNEKSNYILMVAKPKEGYDK